MLIFKFNLRKAEKSAFVYCLSLLAILHARTLTQGNFPDLWLVGFYS